MMFTRVPVAIILLFAIDPSSLQEFKRSESTMSYSVEKVGGPHMLGEGPHWDEDRQVLYYVDAPASSICRYVPKEKKVYQCKLDPSAIVSIIIPMKGESDKFLVTIGGNISEVTWDGKSETPQDIRVLADIGLREGARFNDGKVDPYGRLWVGSLKNSPDGEFVPNAGSLYSFSPDLSVKKHVDDITIANGLAWSSDGTTMYYIDTPTKKVDAFRFDPATGEISDRRTVFDFATFNEMPEGFAGPDGMTIDSEDNIWVAVFGAGAVYNIDPRSGQHIRTVKVPSPNTTSVAFGGPELDELFIVSAGEYLTPEQREKFPDAGVTFRVTGLGVKGTTMHPAYFSS